MFKDLTNKEKKVEIHKRWNTASKTELTEMLKSYWNEPEPDILETARQIFSNDNTPKTDSAET